METKGTKMIAKRDLTIGSKVVAPKGSTCTVKESKLSDGYSIFSEDGCFLSSTTWWNILADLEDVGGEFCQLTTWRELLIRC